MRRFQVLRVLVHLRRFARTAARRAAYASSVCAGCAWWSVSTIATSGWSLILGSVALVLSTATAGVCWFFSGE